MKLHILLVDNEKLIIGSFTDALLRPDSLYKFTCAVDIDHAKQITESIDADYIFINLDANVGEALEFVFDLKKNSRMKNTKVITYSANFSFYQFTSRAYGAHICIQPPVNSGIIYDAINSFDIHTLSKS